MDKVIHPRGSDVAELRSARRQKRRHRRSENLQRRYNFRGAKRSILLIVAIIGISYLLWLGLIFVIDFGIDYLVEPMGLRS